MAGPALFTPTQGGFMKSSSRLTLLVMISIAFGAFQPRSVAAQVLDAINEFYLIQADYDKKQAYPGSRNLYFTVTMKTPVGVNIPANKILKFAKYENPEDSKITMTLDTHEGNRVRDGNVEDVSTFLIKIPEGTEPRIHRIKLKFQYPDESTVDRYVELFVGLRTQGKLRVVQTDYEPLVAGESGVFKIKLANDYPDYPINLHRITFSSVPSNLLDRVDVPDIDQSHAEVVGNAITFKPPLNIPPFQQPTIQLNATARSMSVGNWIAGFGEGSKLSLAFAYDDSYGRDITDLSYESPIKVRPGDGSLLGAMIVGVLIGTGLKFYLEYLRKKGVIDRKGVAVFILITVLVGIIITIVAWGGQIQIIAFKDVHLSYDRPVVIFIIGLIGALGGVHYLNSWVMKYLPSDGRKKEARG
jgi:hypothetical protein